MEPIVRDLETPVEALVTAKRTPRASVSILSIVVEGVDARAGDSLPVS
jgi:hypothetical protein